MQREPTESNGIQRGLTGSGGIQRDPAGCNGIPASVLTLFSLGAFCVSQLMGLKTDLANVRAEHNEEKQAIREAAEDERLVQAPSPRLVSYVHVGVICFFFCTSAKI